MITENAGNVPEVPVESVCCDEVLMPEMGMSFNENSLMEFQGIAEEK